MGIRTVLCSVRLLNTMTCHAFAATTHFSSSNSSRRLSWHWVAHRTGVNLRIEMGQI
jgi:hypothetical protein